jgi:hypothetical protein
MINFINYYSHKLNLPSYYYRQIDNDIEGNEKVTSRVAKIGFEFLFLYKPAANLCNNTLSFIRVSTNFSKCFKHLKNKNSGNIFTDIYATTLSVTSLVANYFNFTIALYITTLNDILIIIFKIYQSIKKNNYEIAFELSFQLINSILYLRIILTGSLEIILISLIFQAISLLIQASKDFKKGRFLEVLANFVLASIKLKNANTQLHLIKKREAFLKIKKYCEIINKIKKGKEIDDLYQHPLIQLVNKINQTKTILKDQNNCEIDFGAHFFGYGKQQVKGMNLSFKEKDHRIELEFKVNHVFREKLATLIKSLNSIESSDLNDLLKIFNSHASEITFNSENSLKIESYYKPKDIVINVKDIAKISIGKSRKVIGLYDRIKICFEKDKNLYDLHEVLAFFDLTDVIKKSAQEDLERMKLGQIFRMCSPKDATKFERTNEFFDLPIDLLKEKIVELVPDMQTNFQKYLSLCEMKEILPGKLRLAIKGLSDELYKLGARNISSVITGAYTDKDLCERVVSIFKMGALSTETRHYADLISNGLSPTSDFKSGGSDSVFTQIVTKNNKSYNELWYSGKVRLLYSLKALDTISYQYHIDSSGNRSLKSWWWGGSYLNRPNIFDFVKKQTNKYVGCNEVMIKERIPPEFIEGIVVESEDLKNKIVKSLENANLTSKDEMGNTTIFGKTINSFFKLA